MSETDAIVVGGGFGGIAASLRLRAKGYNVNLIDRSCRLGGRAQVFCKGGFRHDAGPTVITAPFLFDELFSLFGKNRQNYIEFIKLDPWYQFRFHDGEIFNYGGSIDDTLKEISRINSRDVAGYQSLLDESRKRFDIGFTQLADQPFTSFWKMVKQIPNLARLRADKSVYDLVCQFISDDRLRQALSMQPLLVGGNPFDTTSIYNLIHYLERKWGVFFAKGGTGALVDAFAKLMLEQEIKIDLETTVTKINVKNGKACGVTTKDGRVLNADTIVTDVDPVHLYTNMLDKKHQSPALRLKKKNMKLSMGLFVLYFGTKKKYHEVKHHTIWMGERYRDLLDDIFNKGILADDFSLYIHRPTATDPSFAPEGMDSYYVLAPVPNLKSRIDWSREGPKLKMRIIAELEATLLPELSEFITEIFWMTPEDFRDDYLSHEGSGFSVSPLLTQSAWFRFHNRAEGLQNLYLVGAGTHPGAGLPGVLCSAKVVENIIRPAH